MVGESGSANMRGFCARGLPRLEAAADCLAVLLITRPPPMLRTDPVGSGVGAQPLPAPSAPWKRLPLGHSSPFDASWTRHGGSLVCGTSADYDDSLTLSVLTRFRLTSNVITYIVSSGACTD